MDSKENKNFNSENSGSSDVEAGKNVNSDIEEKTADGSDAVQETSQTVKISRRKKKESIKEKVLGYAKYIAAGTVLILLARPFLFYPLDIMENFHDIKFNFNVANFHAAQKCLSFSDRLSVMSKKTSKSSYKMRNKLFDRYLRIKQNSEMNLYNPIGLFDSINSDFEILTAVNEKSGVQDADYQQYKSRYTAEIGALLGEYKKRSRKYGNFMNSESELKYNLPKRLDLYEKLAEAYLKYERLPVNSESLEKLKKIAETYDEIYQQEKGSQNANPILDFVTSAKPEAEEKKDEMNNGYPPYGGPESSGFYDGMGSMYGGNGGMMNSSGKSSASYPTFAYSYKTAYIITEGVLYMARMCDNAETIKQYIAPLEIQNILSKKEVDKITAMCRDKLPDGDENK